MRSSTGSGAQANVWRRRRLLEHNAQVLPGGILNALPACLPHLHGTRSPLHYTFLAVIGGGGGDLLLPRSSGGGSGGGALAWAKPKRRQAAASMQNLQHRKTCPECSAMFGNAKKGVCGTKREDTGKECT